MKQILMLLIFSSLFQVCDAQGKLNDDAKEQYAIADEHLNTVYKRILKEYGADTVFIKSLKASQKLWIQFRDAEIIMKYPEQEPGYYGSIYPMCRNMYLAQLTLSRANTLMIWLEGMEEGDVCIGSVRMR